MNRACRSHIWPARAAALIALVALVILSDITRSQSLGGQPGLVAADPPPNALLAEAPGRIALTFAEPIAPRSVAVRLLTPSGEETPLPSEIDEDDSARVIARPSGMLGGGDYTVLWSVRLARSGELLSGAYPFRAGVVNNPGAAVFDNAWPAPWATLLRWIVFLGTALAGGGFAWARLIAPAPGAWASGGLPRRGTMTASALVALLATIAAPLPLADAPRSMPLGWWIQIVALAFLALLCLSALASGRAARGLPAMLDWAGLGAGLVALAGLSLTSHVAHPLDRPALALEIAHQWSAALWASGLLYLAADWRGLGSDIARFRVVRWLGGILLAIAVATGIAAAWGVLPEMAMTVASRYGQTLAAKALAVLAILGIGLLAMILPRRSNAVQVSGSLVTQGILALLAMLLSALLALLALPGTVAPTTLAAVELANVIRIDPAALATGTGRVRLLTQPAAPGMQGVVVRITGASGEPLVSDPSPTVEVVWRPLSGDAPATIRTALRADRSGSLFSGSARLPEASWWEAEVIVTSPGGIAARASFWLVLPDPNVTGSGPMPPAEPEARSLFARGLDSLAALQSVRATRRVGDGSGTLTRSEIAMRAASSDHSAAYTKTVIDAEGEVASGQTMIGDERWTLDEETGWVTAAPEPFPTPASMAAAFRDARGFRLGPREEVGSEICQVVTFWLPPGQDSPHPSWVAWWVGLATGEVRREAIISTRRYLVADYRDFNADLVIAPPAPAGEPDRGVAPARRGTPVAAPPR
ncbi:MAG: copper resistance protein CopC [Thermomicrobiales bacterium]|nr:copper resistance protein CopC [Thermomicrobiales bacterium]